MQSIKKFQNSRYIAVFTAALVMGMVFGFGASVWATSLGTDLSVSGNGTVSGNLTVSGTGTHTGAATFTANVIVQSTTATSTLSTGGLNIGSGQFVVQQTNGYVGIGTADPRQVLTVIGNGLFSADLFINGNDINLGNGISTTTISGSGVGIGIGTTTPGAALAISTSTNGTLTAFLVSNAGTGYTAWFEDSANDSTPFVINAAGRVGVGSSSPTTQFAIGAQGEVGGGLYFEGGLGISTSSPGAVLAVATSTAGQKTALLVSNLGTGYSAWVEDAANDTSPFVINAAGSVGVGSSSPAQALSVGGNLYVGATLAGGTEGGLGVGAATTTSGVIETASTSAISLFKGGVNIVNTGTTTLSIHPVETSGTVRRGCIEFGGVDGTFSLYATSAGPAFWTSGPCEATTD